MLQIRKSAAYTRQGFTLTELLITMAIVGILVSVILAQIWRAREQALEARAQVQAHSFSNAVAQY